MRLEQGIGFDYIQMPRNPLGYPYQISLFPMPDKKERHETATIQHYANGTRYVDSDDFVSSKVGQNLLSRIVETFDEAEENPNGELKNGERKNGKRTNGHENGHE